MQDTDSIFSHVISSTLSDSEYLKRHHQVIKLVTQGPKRHVQSFLASIYNILEDDDTSPRQRFYTLLLLVNSTETHCEEIISQLAKSKPLLNRLFHDAQFDKSKPLKDKGKTFFSDEPTIETATIGKNYMRLVLEAFCYWNQEYGTSEEENPLHCFDAVYRALAHQSQLPSNYQYINVNSQLKRIGHQPFKAPENYEAMMQEKSTAEKMKDNEAFSQIMKCVSSEENYEEHKRVVFEEVAKKSFEYNTNLLSAVTEIMTKSNYSYTVKFYTLFLVAQLSEFTNKVFITQLVRETALLNKLYKLAKEIESPKSPRIFKKNDKEGKYRKMLEVLTLECAKFWHTRYGNQQLSNLYFAFTYLYTSICTFVSFPEDYTYIDPDVKELEASSQSLNQTVLKSEKVDVGEQKGKDEEPDNSIMRLVNAYVSSGVAFKDSSANIAAILIKQPKSKTLSYLQGTLEILNSSEKTLKCKFYALYLLMQVTESRNEVLINALAEHNELLDKLAKDAQLANGTTEEERGVKLFSKTPSEEEAVLGGNYMQLLLESLMFWAKTYGVENQRHPYSIFKKMAEKVQKNVTMSERNFYVGRSFEGMDDHMMKKFELIPFQELDKDSTVGSSTIEVTQRETVSLLDLQRKLNALGHSKTILRQFLDSNRINTVDNEEMLDSIVQKVVEVYNKEVHPYLSHLLGNETTNSEIYINKIYLEGKIAHELEQETMNYKLGKLDYFALRDKLLALLQSATANNYPRQSVDTQLRRLERWNTDVAPRVHYPRLSVKARTEVEDPRDYSRYSVYSQERTYPTRNTMGPVSLFDSLQAPVRSSVQTYSTYPVRYSSNDMADNESIGMPSTTRITKQNSTPAQYPVHSAHSSYMEDLSSRRLPVTQQNTNIVPQLSLSRNSSYRMESPYNVRDSYRERTAGYESQGMRSSSVIERVVGSSYNYGQNL